MVKEKDILVIEDSPSQGHFVCGFMERIGFSVRWARDGVEGMKMYEEKTPDLVVTDVNMPRMDGIELCQIIKKKEGATPPIIMMSAANEAQRIDEDIPEALRPDAFLLKPFQLKRLRSEAERLLGIEGSAGPAAEEEPPADVQEGSLEDLPFARLMVHLYQRQKTGRLELSLLQMSTTVYFIGGYPVYVRARQFTNSLGQLLLSAGAITEEEYWSCMEEYARSKIKKTDSLFGEIVMRRGCAGAKVINEALKRQVKEKLLACFMFYKGSYRFVDDDSFMDEILTYRTNPVEVLIEGIDFSFSEALLRSEIERYGDRYIFLDENQVHHIASLDLSANERQTLLAADGEKTLNQLMEASTIRPVRALKLFYPLILLGIIQTSKTPAPHRPELPGTGGPPAADQSGAAERIVGKYLEIKHQNYFEILGVAEDESDDEIRARFRQLVKDFHPNEMGEEVDGELRDHATEIYSRIVHAYRTLSNPDKRRAYLKTLKT